MRIDVVQAVKLMTQFAVDEGEELTIWDEPARLLQGHVCDTSFTATITLRVRVIKISLQTRVALS